VRPDPFSWSFDPAVLLALVVLVAGYALAVRRFPTSRARVGAFAAAVVLLLATAVTPLHALTFHLLSAHLLQNVVLAEWTPALLVLAVAPALATRIGHLALVRPLTHPLVALPLWVATYVLWHVPTVYDTALHHQATLLHLEHATYLVAGFLLWWPALQDEPHRLAPQHRAVYLFAAFLLASPVGLLLALLPDPIYDWYAGGFADWNVSALTDQRAAGVTMAGEEAAVFFSAFSYWFFRFLQTEDEEAIA